KEVVQVYCSAPQGKLGKPSKVLCAYEKTRLLSAGEAQEISVTIKKSDLASYDDSGASGFRSCYVLEAGRYDILVGSDVRSAKTAVSFEISETKPVLECTQALAPVLAFERIKPVQRENGFEVSFENVPLQEVSAEERRLASRPSDIPVTGNKGIKLSDVKNGRNTLTEFIAQLSDYDLSCIIRGEGMGSPKVTAGTAAAFGGVSESLQNMGIPCGCCSDGPSGMRLDCGTKAFSLPNGTLLASTFNKELMTELFELMGMEMSANKVDCLLGPGMNIHRHPLNGRNFEYFSEDPYLTGTIAAAELKGMHKQGVTGTIKHFCGNNQETGRHNIDSVISERALREIYLKGFEIAVRDGNADSIMTTYGAVNGLWTAGSYDLNTTILRNEWGFNGFVMTDWWADINRRDRAKCNNDFAAMAAAQNDVYMVCANGAENFDNTLEELENGYITRGELQRNAANILKFLIGTHAMERVMGTADEIEIINRPADAEDADSGDVIFHDLDTVLEFCPEDIKTVKGSNYVFALDVKIPGFYKATITASSEMGALAQMPVTIFSMGTPYATFTWNGTEGKPVSFSAQINFFSRFTTIRLYFAQSGLKIENIKFELTQKF
ncbi:MAG: glycoside hydrolase family 3 N-terminal domain-containing protein, partial [Huintestinicola sp.]